MSMYLPSLMCYCHTQQKELICPPQAPLTVPQPAKAEIPNACANSGQQIVAPRLWHRRASSCRHGQATQPDC
eukprot:5556764-Prymnesium_polylepis.2